MKKLVNLGSTQRNENLNHVIASKSLKVRYYGGSESNDFRTAAGVAQFNESHSYLVSVSVSLGHTTCADLLGHYVGRKNVKRLQQTRRQNTYKFRRNRKIKTQERRSKAKKVEESEGITYESGIGLSDPELLALQKIVENPSDTTEVTNWLKENHSEDKNSQKLKPMKLTSNPIILFYDLETGGFRKTADRIQIAITKGNGNHSEDINVFVMPKKKLDGRSVKVHGYTVSYKTGKKTLVNRENEEMPAVSPLEAAKAVTEYLIHVCRSSESPVLLIAHNGHSFDQPRLLAFLREQEQIAKLSPFMGKIYFSDSKPTFKETFNLEKNSISSVYAHVFGEANYAAHDAYGDVQALSDIFIASKFSKILEEKVKY